MNGSMSVFRPAAACSIDGTLYATCGEVRTGPVTGLSGSNRSHSILYGCATKSVIQTRVASTKTSPGCFSVVIRPTWENSISVQVRWGSGFRKNFLQHGRQDVGVAGEAEVGGVRAVDGVFAVGVEQLLAFDVGQALHAFLEQPLVGGAVLAAAGDVRSLRDAAQKASA